MQYVSEARESHDNRRGSRRTGGRAGAYPVVDQTAAALARLADQHTEGDSDPRNTAADVLGDLADEHAGAVARRPHKRTKGSWYIVTAKGDVGPLGNREILAAAKRGDINPGTNLRHGRASHPILAGQVRGLFSRTGQSARTTPRAARAKAAVDTQVKSA